MKKRLLYASMVIATTITSCTNEMLNDLSTADDTINIVASIASQTRTPQLTTDGSGNFLQGDKMMLFLSENDINNMSVNYEYGSGILTWSSLGLSESKSQITIAACYPQQNNIQNGTFEFNSLTALDKDLLLAPAQSVMAGTSEAIFLNFSHALHRLDLSFSPGNSYTNDDIASISVTINAKTTCIVDGIQGKIKQVQDTTGEYTETGSKVSFYLIPQNTANITLNVSIGNDKKTLTLDKLLEQLDSSQIELDGGKRCILNLKVSREGITVEGGSINAWGDQVVADGEIVLG